MTVDLSSCSIETPLGAFFIIVSDAGLRSASLGGAPIDTAQPNGGRAALLEQSAAQFEAYFSGGLKHFTLPIDWQGIPAFQRSVLTAISEVRWGSLTTYGALARKLSKPGAARAVGSALGANPFLIIVPCHRAVGSDGKMHGFGTPAGIPDKVWLLRHEGHEIINGKSSPDRESTK